VLKNVAGEFGNRTNREWRCPVEEGNNKGSSEGETAPAGNCVAGSGGVKGVCNPPVGAKTV